jgi:hypothetical protein
MYFRAYKARVEISNLKFEISNFSGGLAPKYIKTTADLDKSILCVEQNK